MVYAMFVALGGLRITEYLNRDKVIILMLHGVMDEQIGDVWRPLRRQMSPAELDAVLGILSKRHQFISLTDAVAMVRGEIPWQPNCIAVTFDDGYRNNLTHALPVMKKHNIVPTVFAATGHSYSGKAFWVDRIDFALQHLPAPHYDATFGNFTHRFVTTDRRSLMRSYRTFLRKCKYEMDDDREMLAALDSVATDMERIGGRSLADLHNQDSWSAVADWGELVAHVECGDIEVGSHTVNHIRLSRVPEEVIHSELSTSLQHLEAELPEHSNVFCYPNGDCHALSERLVAEKGFSGAIIAGEGLAKKGDNPYRLKRFACPRLNTEAAVLVEVSGVKQFIAGLCGWFRP